MEIHRLQSDSDQRRLLDGSPLIEGCADGLEFRPQTEELTSLSVRERRERTH